MQDQPQSDQFLSNDQTNSTSQGTSLDNPANQSDAPSFADSRFEWEAAEYDLDEKDKSWYGALLLAAFILTGIIYLLTRDIFATFISLFVIAGFGYAGVRKPRQVRYVVSGDGIQVGNKTYAFSDFRSFHVSEEEKSPSIIFIPLKRFMPAINICIARNRVEQVVDYIAQILPMEQHKTDFVEKLMHRLHL